MKNFHKEPPLRTIEVFREHQDTLKAIKENTIKKQGIAYSSIAITSKVEKKRERKRMTKKVRTKKEL